MSFCCCCCCFTKYSQLSPCGHLAITDTPLTRTALLTPVSVISLIIRDGPLENLLGGEGGEEPKKYSRQGKLNEKKNSCTPINPEDIRAMA